FREVEGPDVVIFRGSLEEPGDGFKIHLAEDIYPNQPNVRYRAVFFNPDVFEEGWDTKQVGPFVVAVRSH
ncbi:arabinofuranosyltransferase, partial [Bacteroides fragilis]|nr:arabinofuranosyltransferase [Bacteroides fragilis]